MKNIQVLSASDFPKDLSWDSSFKIIFILNGEMHLQVGTKERRLSIHDITYIKPYEMYGNCISSKGCSAYVLDIEQDIWNVLCPGADSLGFSISILKPTGKHSTYGRICHSLSQVLHYSNTSEGYSPARIYKAISDIIAVLIENYSTGPMDTSPSDQTVSRARLIMNYIRENYTRRFSLEEIAGEIGFHPQYFSSYFKKQFGSNFTDYLNAYRISKGAVMLKESNQSIISIAMNCGFNNHKTFGNAFEKIYGCTPRDFRKQNSDQNMTGFPDPDSTDFDYLRQFWVADRLENSDYITVPQSCNIIIKDPSPVYINDAANTISVGRAIACLRSDMQEQIRQAKADMNLEYARIRDIFSDDLFVYYEDEQKHSSYSWRTLDQIFDFLLSCGLKPFIEIGYMPEQMASKKQYAGWQYHPNVSFPKSVKLWQQLVENFLTHLYATYGKSVVNTWRFDFWTAPNIQMSEGYWNESIEKFFQFYDITYKSVKKIAPELVFGSPNFSYPSGLKYYYDFFQFAREHDISIDFLSIHMYGCGDGLDDSTKKTRHYLTFAGNHSIPTETPERDHIPNAMKALRKMLADNSCPDLPILMDDWNITFYPTDYTRDTCFMAPYVVDTYFKCLPNVYAMGYSSLSDVHEDFFNMDQLFSGGPGLMTYNGIPKAGYLALQMAYNFSRNIIQQDENYVVGKTDTGYEILIYNLDFYDENYAGNTPSVISFTQRYNVFESTPDLGIHIELPVTGSECNIIKTLINRQHGSAYDTWVSMGSPAKITQEMTKYLKQVSVPAMNYHSVKTNGVLILDDIIEPHSVLHIDIREIF